MRKKISVLVIVLVSLLIIYHKVEVKWQTDLQIIDVPEAIVERVEITQGEQEEEQDEEELPYDQLFITPTRQGYEAGDMVLKIPSLAIEHIVYGQTDEKNLKEGPCLYEYAQLPNEEGANVSIASHRIKKRGGFLEINKLEEGDLLYLVYKDSIYSYIYAETQIVEENDWRVIYRQKTPTLTLTSCEPAINPTHRIVVTAALMAEVPYSDEYDYLGKIQ